MQDIGTYIKKLKTLIIGKAHNPLDSDIFHKLSLIALFAWVGLGSDAMSSASYGPEEAYLALGENIYLAIFVAMGIIVTIFVITVLHQLDQKIIYPHYDFKHLTEKYFEIGMKLNDFSIQLVKY